MRKDVVVDVSAADHARLEAIVADRNSPQKHVWRAQIILLTSQGSRPYSRSGQHHRFGYLLEVTGVGTS